MALVDAACEERTRLGNVRIDALHVRLGPLAGVVEEALAFSFALAAAGTDVDGARDRSRCSTAAPVRRTRDADYDRNCLSP